jgi:alkylation response protein AidB-like acyl-CoA dehydrogenase
MDVTVAPIPPEYDDYRDRLQAFIAEHLPVLESKQRAGLRQPETAADVDRLRGWVHALSDAGYVLARFSDGPTDEHEQRILETELTATGVPYILGNPLVSGAIKAFGTPEQMSTYLPAMSDGRHIWTQLFSEPNAGSDLTGLQSRAELDGDHYVLNGQKVWSTWAEWSDFGYLLARTEPVPGPAGITAFILDMRSAGVEVRPLRELTGTTDFSEVFFDDVHVPVANVIGRPGEGWKVANASLATERGGVGGAGSGAAIDALARLAAHSRRGDGPAIEDSAVRQDIGLLAARALIHRALGYRVATKALRGTVGPADAPLTKIWYSELNLQLAEYALGVQGPRSIADEGDPLAEEDGRWQDMFLYARAWTIAGGSNEIMRNVLAERVLGLPREHPGPPPPSRS